jgi:hypothetical protein
MQKLWKDIPEFEDKYEVSNFGEVRRKGKEKILKPSINGNGYKRIKLWRGNSYKWAFIHKLVALCFIKKPRRYLNKLGIIVNHKDGNKFNNRITNLEYMTLKENTIHARDVLYRKFYKVKD